MRQSILILVALAALVAAACVGCGDPNAKRKVEIERRQLPANIGSQELRGDTVATVYEAPAFVYATEGGARVVDDTSAEASSLPLDDTRLLVLVEGSGDTLEGFRHTARLIASSPWCWQDSLGQRPLLILPIHWSQSTNSVAEHLNYDAQRRGSVNLLDTLEVHLRRCGDRPDASVSVMAFSAGTRVAQMAFGCTIDAGASRAVDGGDRPACVQTVRNVTFIGASLARTDPLPFDCIRGRFVNFVNKRDTHFGDRAPYAAPPGAGPDFKAVFNTRFLQREPGFGASANGFDALPWLTAPGQFFATAQTTEGREAFRMVNYRVPPQLKAYNVVGQPLENDDLDDFINLAPNHYIMAGRGPGGTTTGGVFQQYRAMAADFVQNMVAPALAAGEVPVDGLTAKASPINPLKVLTTPLEVPGKLVEPLIRSRDQRANGGETAPEPSSNESAAPSDGSSERQ